jgi:hypothetical protein
MRRRLRRAAIIRGRAPSLSGAPVRLCSQGGAPSASREARCSFRFTVPLSLKKIIRKTPHLLRTPAVRNESTQAKATGNRPSSRFFAFAVGCGGVLSLKLAVQSSKCSRSAALARCSQYSASASSFQLLSGSYAALCRHNDAIARKRRTFSIPSSLSFFPPYFLFLHRSHYDYDSELIFTFPAAAKALGCDFRFGFA